MVIESENLPMNRYVYLESDPRQVKKHARLIRGDWFPTPQWAILLLRIAGWME